MQTERESTRRLRTDAHLYDRPDRAHRDMVHFDAPSASRHVGARVLAWLRCGSHVLCMLCSKSSVDARAATPSTLRDGGGARRSREAFRDSWRGRTWAKAYLLRLFAHLTPPLAWLTLLTSGLAGSSDPLLTWGGAARTGAHLTPLLTWLTRGSPRRTVVPGCKRFMHSNCVRQLGDIH